MTLTSPPAPIARHITARALALYGANLDACRTSPPVRAAVQAAMGQVETVRTLCGITAK